MSIRIVQLGSERKRGEGIRFGTVRRPPRGVPKARHRGLLRELLEERGAAIVG